MSKVLVPASTSTLILNGIVIPDFIAGDFLTLESPNASFARTYGSNGAVTATERVDADVANLTVNVIRYSDSDIALNSLLRNKSQFVEGSLRRVVTRDGVELDEVFTMEGGTFAAKPTLTSNNTDGNDTVPYVIEFSKVVRSI